MGWYIFFIGMIVVFSLSFILEKVIVMTGFFETKYVNIDLELKEMVSNLNMMFRKVDISYKIIDTSNAEIRIKEKTPTPQIQSQEEKERINHILNINLIILKIVPNQKRILMKLRKKLVSVGLFQSFLVVNA